MGIADNVVVEDGFDLPALGLGIVGQGLAAVEALFLALDHGVDEGGGELVP